MTQTVRIELSRPGPLPTLYATAGDQYSRFVKMELYENGAPYTPPEGTACLVGWRREGGACGNYSTITESDDTTTHSAYQLQGSALTVELSADVCRLAGRVFVNVALIGADGARLHTWELVCQVERGAVADSEDGSQPSESASQAANRAEKAAQDAEAALGQVDGKIDAAVQGVTDEAKQAAKNAAASAGQAAASAEKVDAALNELDGMLEDGPVVSVNGKTGRVTLTAADVQALGLPAAPQVGQLLVIEAVGEDGSVTVGTADSAPGGGLVVSDTYIPVEDRKEGMLYFFTDSDSGGSSE